MKKCEVIGCRCEAKWSARKLFGKGGTLNVCDEHKPGGKRPARLKNLPPVSQFYEISSIGEAK